MKRVLTLTVPLVLLAGCIGPNPYITPVESRSVEPVTPPPSGTVVPVQPSTAVSVSPILDTPTFRPSAPQAPTGQLPAVSQPVAPQSELPALNQNSSSAVVALLGEARQAADRGDLSGAESQVERALRISPRDPQVYLQLASLKRQQGEYLQAEQVALRGVAVAAALPDYKRLLWKELARIRFEAGDRDGAAVAEREAARF